MCGGADNDNRYYGGIARLRADSTAENGSAPDAAQEVNTAQEGNGAQDGSTAQEGTDLQAEDWPEEITVVQMPNENNPNVGAEA